MPAWPKAFMKRRELTIVDGESLSLIGNCAFRARADVSEILVSRVCHCEGTVIVPHGSRSQELQGERLKHRVTEDTEFRYGSAGKLMNMQVATSTKASSAQ